MSHHTDHVCDDRRPTVTVGPSGADIAGATGRAIQLAVDAVAAAGRGGGTVRVLPGEYTLDDAVRLRAGVALVGERDKVLLKRGPLAWSDLAVDADTGEARIVPADASAFRPGMGVTTWAPDRGWGLPLEPRTVVDVRDGVLVLDDLLTFDRQAASGGRVVNEFPMILAARAHGARVEGLSIDASVDDSEGVLDGMRTAGVSVIRSPGVTVRGVTSTGCRGDGICVEFASVGCTVDDCETFGNTFYGVHVGSHSAEFTCRGCNIHDNGSDGLYICWGVRRSTFENHRIWRNGWRQLRSGISIGHKDTDNLLARNHVYENAKYGVSVRRKTEANGAHRNTWRENTIENNGSRPDQLAEVKRQLDPDEAVGCGIHVAGVTRDNVFAGNCIRETRSGDEATQRIGICLAEGVSGTQLADNTLEGHADGDVADRSGGIRA